MAIQATNYDGTQDYEVAEIKDVYKPNLLINGDFQCWQRGTDLNLENGDYGADMWKCYALNATKVRIQKVTNGLKVIELVGVSTCNFYQKRPDLSGKIGIFSYSVNGSVKKKNVTIDSSGEGMSINELKVNDVINWARFDEGTISFDHVKENYVEALNRCRYWIYGITYIKFDGQINYITGKYKDIALYFSPPLKMYSKPTLTASNISCSNVDGDSRYLEPYNIEESLGEVYRIMFSITDDISMNANLPWTITIQDFVLTCEPL